MPVSIDLSHIEPFRGLPEASLTRLAMLGRAHTFTPGSRLHCQGDTRSCLYVILRGRVRLERALPGDAPPSVLAELGPGAVVGGGGLLDGTPCPATTVAMDTVEALQLSYAAVALTLLQYPEASTSLLLALGEQATVA